MSGRIVLYDICSKLQPQAWSPNVWKARYVLNYKRLPYDTVWVSYQDIRQLWETLGLSPLRPPGGAGPVATLPVISIPSQDGGPPTVIAESLNIALYLECEYPDTPRVFLPNTTALQAAFSHLLPTLLAAPMLPLLLPATPSKLDDRGAEYFRQTRKEWYRIQTDSPPQDTRRNDLDKLRRAFTSLFEILNTNRSENDRGSDPEWVMGTLGPTYADFALGAYLTWLKRIGDQETWDQVAAWNGGKWSKFYRQLEPWSRGD